MKLTGLHIFLILLASIVFCACLGDDKKVIEGAAGNMSGIESRRNDNIRRERRQKEMSRELENYRKDRGSERREHEDRIRRDREERTRRRERQSRRRDKREHDDYDRNDEIYRRMNEERFDVDDHTHKRRTRNRARMHPMPGKRMPNADKYMLKSEVVPPVCPACPGGGTGGGGRREGDSNIPPQPCPPCARCPEPAFECKKVPNYNSTNTSGLPKPVLSDFSTFGG